MALALEQELYRSMSTLSMDSLFDSLPSSPAESEFSSPSPSAYSTPATSATPSPCPSRTVSWVLCPPEEVTVSEYSDSCQFLSLPSEIRARIYSLALADTTINVCSATLHRRRGGPNRTKLIRRLPGILTANKQIRDEALPLLAENADLAFSDFFNFSHLINRIPDDFAAKARKISLRGDVIVTPELLQRFPSLEQVHYTQLGNCTFAPTKENGFNQYASEASNAELVESVKARSASLVLLKTILWQVNESRRALQVDGIKEGGIEDVQLTATANVLSSRQRVSLVINVNQRRVLSREVVAEGHFFD